MGRVCCVCTDSIGYRDIGYQNPRVVRERSGIPPRCLSRNASLLTGAAATLDGVRFRIACCFHLWDLETEKHANSVEQSGPGFARAANRPVGPSPESFKADLMWVEATPGVIGAIGSSRFALKPGVAMRLIWSWSFMVFFGEKEKDSKFHP